MSDEYILHIMPRSVFFKHYVEFLHKEDSLSRHWFISPVTVKTYVDFPEANLVNIVDSNFPFFIKNLDVRKQIISLFENSSMVINHGYIGVYYLLFLLFHPSFLRKTLWVVWGPEVMTYATYKQDQNQQSLSIFHKYLMRVLFYIYFIVRKYIFRHIKYVVARNPEYKIIKESFCKNIQQLQVSALYVSPKSLYVPSLKISKHKSKYNILLGHSAFSAEHHLQWIDTLIKFRDNIQLYLILSYGNAEYGANVEKYALEVFGDSVTIIKNMMDYNDYQDFISSMDVGILSALGQTGLGCIFSLLRCGKKVYLHPDSINKKVTTDKGYVTYSTTDIAESSFADFIQLPDEVIKKNISLDDRQKTYEQTIDGWKYIFDEIPGKL